MQLPTGTTYSVASALGTAKATTIVTNASEAVVTSTGHGYANGDYVIISSGWGRLNDSGWRIKSIATDTFVLEGCDTTSTEFFPVGSGIGSVKKVTTFTQVTTIMNPQASGGEPQSVEVKILESDVRFSINDGFSAISESFDIDADTIGTAGYTALKALSSVQTVTLLKKNLRSGSIIITPGKIALNENPKLNEGAVVSCAVAFNATNRVTRYAS